MHEILEIGNCHVIRGVRPGFAHVTPRRFRHLVHEVNKLEFTSLGGGCDRVQRVFLWVLYTTKLRWLAWYFTSQTTDTELADTSRVELGVQQHQQQQQHEGTSNSNNTTTIDLYSGGGGGGVIEYDGRNIINDQNSWSIVIGPNHFLASLMILMHISIMAVFTYMIFISPGSRLKQPCENATIDLQDKQQQQQCDVTFGDAIANISFISDWILPSIFTFVVKNIIFLFFILTFGMFTGILLKDPGIRHPLLLNTAPTDPNYHYPADLPSNINEMRLSLVARNPNIRLRKVTRGWTYDNIYFFCDCCGTWSHKNEDVEHCEECNVCIFGYDHHCPWTSKCIGRDNFVNFVMWIALVLASIGVWTFGIISLKKPD